MIAVIQSARNPAASIINKEAICFKSSSQIIQSNHPTMTSLEISELTGKRHDHVLRDARNMLDEIQSPQVWGDYQDSRGRAQPCILLTKDESICLVAGYSAKMRMAIIKRWQQLESQQAPVVPRTYAEALLEAGRLALEVEQQAQQLALAAPKVEFVDKYVAATGNLGFRQVAKLLKVKEPELRDFLLGNRIMYRLAGALTPYAEHIAAGRFEVKAGVADHGDSSHAYSQAKITPKGVEWLAGELAKHQARQAVATKDNE